MTFNIKDFGAVGDGRTLNTEAIQSAIDKCTASGGGSVIVSGGTYMTGTIVLKDNVDLHIEADGRLLGSPSCGRYEEGDDPNARRDLVAKAADYGDYPDFPKKHVCVDNLPRHRGSALIFAEEQSNISITGKGVIDANGECFIEKVPEGVNYWMPYRRIDAPTPPRVVFFTGCRNVVVEDVTMTNQPAGWSYWIHDCDYVNFDRVRILAKVEYPNNDGIHINCSRNVTVSNSFINCGDDAIIVRANNLSLKENKVCERVTVTNCNLTSHSGGIRIGWVNDGVIRNCTFSNLVMTDTTVGVSISFPKKKSAPSDFGREATLVENLVFSNIVMDGTYSFPIRMKIEEDPELHINAIRNIYFSNIHARGLRLPFLVGRKDNPLENIKFSDCTFEVLSPENGNDGRSHGAAEGKAPESPKMEVAHVNRLSFNNTDFITH